MKSQLPQGLLQFHVEEMKNLEYPTPIEIPRFFCEAYYRILLDGRFLMEKEHFDLRHLIDEEMKLRTSKDCGPFSKEEVELVMHQVDIGVEWIHEQGIFPRDLKVSNVLVEEIRSGWPQYECVVADYKCLVGVVGTRFFSAPEILQACKDFKVKERPEMFSKATDIFGYGMICYEVLTGKRPFEELPISDYDHVFSGHRPLVPEHVEDWIHELLDRCWQSDPATRSCIGDVFSAIITHSKHARKREEYCRNVYGENYREGDCVSESRS